QTGGGEMIATSSLSLRARLIRLIGPSLVGVIAVAVGLGTDSTRTWSNLLIDGFYVLSAALGGMVFIAVQQLAGSAWSVGMRRAAEAIMCALPVAALMMLAVFFGRTDLYAWASSAPTLERAASLGSRYFASPF